MKEKQTTVTRNSQQLKKAKTKNYQLQTINNVTYEQHSVVKCVISYLKLPEMIASAKFGEAQRKHTQKELMNFI